MCHFHHRKFETISGAPRRLRGLHPQPLEILDGALAPDRDDEKIASGFSVPPQCAYMPDTAPCSYSDGRHGKPATPHGR